MSGLAIQVDLRDGVSPVLGALERGLGPSQVNPIVGRSARNTVREHLFGVDATRPNALGGPRTHFYTAAGRATQFRAQGDTVVVSINHVGIAQRYFGGTIKPKTGKYLTIPAIPEAHGKRASEFQGLSFSVEKDEEGRVRPALVQGAATVIGFRRSRGTVRARAIGERQRRVVFWLVKQVTQQPDPTVLPHEGLVETRAVRAVADYVQLLKSRRPGAN